MILSFGSLNADVVTSVPHFVRAGETLASTSVALHGGGKGANQSVALARAGAKVAHAGKVGRDGGWMVESLAREGVDVTHIAVDPELLSGQAFIQVTPQGENAIVLSPGANGALGEADFTRVLGAFSKTDVLLVQNEISNMPTLLKLAAGKGMPVVLNAAPCVAEIAAWPLSAVRLLVVNETEGSILTGETEPDAVLRAATARWPHMAVLLTLGGQGAWWAFGSERHHQAVFPGPVVDTTAAGDTFLGYFLAAWAAGLAPVACLERAAAAASITVGRPGAAESIPQVREVDDLLRQARGR